VRSTWSRGVEELKGLRKEELKGLMSRWSLKGLRS